MKKLLALTAVAALAASALPAEITFSLWGRALWNVAGNSYDGKNSTVVTDVHQSWSGAAPRLGISASGSTENVGFKLDIHNNGQTGNDFATGDNALAWVKPIEQVRLVVGHIGENTLRGDACFGLWDWDRIGAVNGMGLEGWTFAGYLNCDGVNAIITPMEALTIGVKVPLSTSGEHDITTTKDSDGNVESDPYTIGSLQDAWLNSAIVAAYDIEGTGTVKVGLKLNTLEDRGSWSHLEKDENGLIIFDQNDNEKYASGLYANQATDKEGKYVKTWCQIAAAFDLTAVENLYASLGARINTLNTKGHEVNAYGRYNVNDQLTIHAVVGTKISVLDSKEFDEGKKAKKDCYNGFGFAAGVGVAYALENNVTLEADVRYANGVYMAGTSADKKDAFTFGVGATKNLGAGLLGIAVEGTTNGGNDGYSRYKQEKPETFAWEIPVKFQYSF